MMMTLRLFPLKRFHIEASTAWYLSDLGELRGKQELYNVVADRRPVFRDLLLGRIVVREMMRLQAEGAVESLAFVVMPDHLHWLMLLQGDLELSEVMRRLKGRSARLLA